MNHTKHTIPLGVALVHLVSGEDLIARVEYDAENRVYSLSRPTTPILQPNSDTQTIALISYCPFLDPDEPLLIRDVNVLFTGKVVAQLEQHYADSIGKLTEG